jgi:hypothetical protein
MAQEIIKVQWRVPRCHPVPSSVLTPFTARLAPPDLSTNYTNASGESAWQADLSSARAPRGLLAPPHKLLHFSRSWRTILCQPRDRGRQLSVASVTLRTPEPDIDRVEVLPADVPVVRNGDHCEASQTQIRRFICGRPTCSILHGFLAIGSARAQVGAVSNHNATRQDFDQLMKQISNWGRWGKNDQLGAVNLITQAKRKQALASVKEGFSVSMARTAEMEPAIDNPRPIVHETSGGRGGSNPPSDISGASDTFFIAYHGFVHTHVDFVAAESLQAQQRSTGFHKTPATARNVSG